MKLLPAVGPRLRRHGHPRSPADINPEEPIYFGILRQVLKGDSVRSFENCDGFDMRQRFFMGGSSFMRSPPGPHPCSY